MKNILLPVLICFAMSGCGSSSNGNPVDDPNVFYYLALGDSYTIGESVDSSERFPEQLGALLVADPMDRNVRSFAQTGWTTGDLAAAIAGRSDFRENYDLVSLLIGVNNQFRGRSLSEYSTEFRALLETAIDFAGNDPNRVFVVSIPDYAYTPFGAGDVIVSQEIDAFNAENAAITAEYGIQYFDITPISRNGLIEPELVAGDGLHPSAEQYRRWVELMIDDVRMMPN